MHVAITEGHYDVVRKLLEIGMRIDDCDKKGRDSIKLA